MKTFQQFLTEQTSAQKAKLPCPKNKKDGKHNWSGGRFTSCVCGATKGSGYRLKK
jgi:hypothetical protein